MSTYPRLGIVDFGKTLIRTGDLDPAYLMLQRVNLGDAQLARWLLAYWCTYHAGVASLLSEYDGEKFWDQLEGVAENYAQARPCPATSDGRWPRNKERRHWRGKAAMDSAYHLRKTFAKPEHVLTFLRYGDSKKGTKPEGTGVTDIIGRTQTLVGFGPWIAFKVADMIDALGFNDLDFSRATVFMFDNPQAAAIDAWRVQQGLPETAKPKDPVAIRDAVVDWLLTQFDGLACPHNNQRGIRVQEVETVLCKWKSHRSGHYGPLNDVREAISGLETWEAHSPTAEALLNEANALLSEALS